MSIHRTLTRNVKGSPSFKMDLRKQGSGCLGDKKIKRTSLAVLKFKEKDPGCTGIRMGCIVNNSQVKDDEVSL